MRTAGSYGEDHLYPSRGSRSSGRDTSNSKFTGSGANLPVTSLCWVFTGIIGVENCAKCALPTLSHLLFTRILDSVQVQRKLPSQLESKRLKFTSAGDQSLDLLDSRAPISLSSLHPVCAYATVKPCETPSQAETPSSCLLASRPNEARRIQVSFNVCLSKNN